MEFKYCKSCGSAMNVTAKFCQHCGVIFSTNNKQNDTKKYDKNSSTQTKSAKVWGVFASTFTSWAGAGCLFNLGLLFSLTGIGAIVGIPLIIIAIVVLILGPIMGFYERKGRCPWCGTLLNFQDGVKGIICRACKKPIEIRDRKFVKIE